ncbi:hypothetical protein CALVIDRAFT_569800 [Calocera viscosa TUFC12733]|uniref:Uncharacterized protein n=1 Tax=Calocera viscosa (strain TUFC12733) TaxID=1330018 RepID=A0A167FJV0_CALVF|nr:hypothetical protein CALVIDRAFT_569800 [Calocera viscosa TUFC12733]
MVVNPDQDLLPQLDANGVELPLPANDRRSGSHYHVLRVAFFDDKMRRLCWHFLCCYSRTWPDKACGYKELEMHFEIRIVKKQPLVAPAHPIAFPPGQGPSWLPPRKTRTEAMLRIWQLPDDAQLERAYQQRRDLGALVVGWDELDESDDEAPNDQPREASPPYDEETLPRDPVERDRLYWKLFNRRFKAMEDFDRNARRWDANDQEDADHRAAVAADLHKMSLLCLPPGQINGRILNDILAGRRSLVRVRNRAAEVQFKAAHTIPITEDCYDKEDWSTRWKNLKNWLRTDGIAFALPFLHECLEVPPDGRAVRVS